MDFNATVDLIIKDLEEARAIIDDLKNYQGVPILQIEMARSKCKSAAEVIALLKDLQDKPKGREIIGSEQVQADKEVISSKVVPEEPEPEPEPEPKPAKTEIIIETTQKTREKKTELSIIADRFSQPPDSLNEKLGIKREDDDYSDVIRSKPVTNLSDAIGVNDKFLFIREIFDGNPESYEQAISRLDHAENLSAAKEIIKIYTEDNIESRVTKQLIELLKRKFPSDE